MSTRKKSNVKHSVSQDVDGVDAVKPKKTVRFAKTATKKLPRAPTSSSGAASEEAGLGSHGAVVNSSHQRHGDARVLPGQMVVHGKRCGGVMGTGGVNASCVDVDAKTAVKGDVIAATRVVGKKMASTAGVGNSSRDATGAHGGDAEVEEDSILFDDMDTSAAPMAPLGPSKALSAARHVEDSRVSMYRACVTLAQLLGCDDATLKAHAVDFHGWKTTEVPSQRFRIVPCRGFNITHVLETPVSGLDETARDAHTQTLLDLLDNSAIASRIEDMDSCHIDSSRTLHPSGMIQILMRATVCHDSRVYKANSVAQAMGLPDGTKLVVLFADRTGIDAVRNAQACAIDCCAQYCILLTRDKLTPPSAKAVEITRVGCRAYDASIPDAKKPSMFHFMLSELQGNICRMTTQPLVVMPLCHTRATRVRTRFGNAEFKVIFVDDAYAKAQGFEVGMVIAALEVFGRNQPEWSYFEVKPRILK
jgi:hypothetical protein